jgi:hypothetical protein
VLFVVCIVFSACASNIPPSGGPEDKEPPTVIKTYPENRQVSFKESTIEIEFSEYVNRGSVLQNVVIQPRTVHEYSWKGTILKIHFLEPLRDSTTYSLSISNDFTDLQQNKPNSPISLAFSTGNTIDSAKIYGKIVGAFPEGVQIFAYKLGSADTCNPKHRFPDYNKRIASDGSFSFESISDGTYRLFAIKDELSNSLFDERQDMFSVAPGDVKAQHFVADSIRFRICPADYFQEASVLEVKGISTQEVEIQFSKEVFISTISKETFNVFDSTTSEKIPILSVGKTKHAQKEVTLVFEKPLLADKKYGYTLSNTAKQFKDVHSFVVPSKDSAIYFSPRSSPYETNNFIASVSKKDSIQNLQLTDSLEIILAKPLSLNATIELKTQSGQKQSLLKNPSIRTYFSVPFFEFINDVWNPIVVEIKDKELQFDTTLTMNLKTQDIRNFGKIKGSIVKSNSSTPIILTLTSSKRNGKTYKQIVTNQDFSFDNIEEGAYTMEIVVDEDNDGAFSCGKLEPFSYCEKVISHPTIFEVKPRWTIDKVIIKIPE